MIQRTEKVHGTIYMVRGPRKIGNQSYMLTSINGGEKSAIMDKGITSC